MGIRNPVKMATGAFVSSREHSIKIVEALIDGTPFSVLSILKFSLELVLLMHSCGLWMIQVNSISCTSNLIMKEVEQLKES